MPWDSPFRTVLGKYSPIGTFLSTNHTQQDTIYTFLPPIRTFLSTIHTELLAKIRKKIYTKIQNGIGGSKDVQIKI